MPSNDCPIADNLSVALSDLTKCHNQRKQDRHDRLQAKRELAQEHRRERQVNRDERKDMLKRQKEQRWEMRRHHISCSKTADIPDNTENGGRGGEGASQLIYSRLLDSNPMTVGNSWDTTNDLSSNDDGNDHGNYKYGNPRHDKFSEELVFNNPFDPDTSTLVGEANGMNGRNGLHEVHGAEATPAPSATNMSRHGSTSSKNSGTRPRQNSIQSVGKPHKYGFSSRLRDMIMNPKPAEANKHSEEDLSAVDLQRTQSYDQTRSIMTLNRGIKNSLFKFGSADNKGHRLSEQIGTYKILTQE